MQNKFLQDLSFGQYYEELFITLIEHDGYKRCNNKYYDIELLKGDKLVYYEVKCDKMLYRTNNICIEFECYNKDSGITTTKADKYVIFELFPDETFNLYVIPVKRIKQQINEKTYKRVMNGGDYKSSKFYLFDKEIFKKYLIIKKNS